MACQFNASVLNSGDFRPIFKFTDKATGELIDFTGAYIEVEVKDQDGCKKFEGTTDGGQITILDTGRFQLVIPAATMQGLCPAQYKWGGLFTLNDEQEALFTGVINVRDGVAKR